MKKILSILFLVLICIYCFACSHVFSISDDYNCQQDWSIQTEQLALEKYPKYVNYIENKIYAIGLEYKEETICNHMEGVCADLYEDCFFIKRYIFSENLIVGISISFNEKKPKASEFGQYFTYRYTNAKEIDNFPKQILQELNLIEDFCCWYVKENILTYYELFEQCYDEFKERTFNTEIEKISSTFFEKSSYVTEIANQRRRIRIVYNNGYWEMEGRCEPFLSDKNIL